MIHRAAAVGFARAPEAYERGRPDYPAAAVSWVLEQLPAGATVLDLAAGTGKLTRPLLAAGLEVVAVEPVEEMRALLPAAARSLEGRAEAIPLEEDSVDGVTVAQAFHWFDGEAALAEIHRVLRPAGLLALVWNRRVEDHPLNRALDELLEPHRHGTPTHRLDAWRAAFERTQLFESLRERVFANPQELDADGLEARASSISFVASLEDAERSAVLRQVRDLAREGTVTLPYRCEVQACRAR